MKYNRYLLIIISGFNKIVFSLELTNETDVGKITPTNSLTVKSKQFSGKARKCLRKRVEWWLLKCVCLSVCLCRGTSHSMYKLY